MKHSVHCRSDVIYSSELAPIDSYMGLYLGEEKGLIQDLSKQFS